eukprot:TRINITY_DN9982_c0_g1_i1.p1 TRINITY_DN9982_c0_g1~~TRINITY_DN9982_c0_g1_i1.p1  ORF type:complete len:248 (-),score=36.81 TRINITY_DN9982_c0_g1_i1:313-1026(-)
MDVQTSMSSDERRYFQLKVFARAKARVDARFQQSSQSKYTAPQLISTSADPLSIEHMQEELQSARNELAGLRHEVSFLRNMEEAKNLELWDLQERLKVFSRREDELLERLRTCEEEKDQLLNELQEVLRFHDDDIYPTSNCKEYNDKKGCISSSKEIMKLMQENDNLKVNNEMLLCHLEVAEETIWHLRQWLIQAGKKCEGIASSLEYSRDYNNALLHYSPYELLGLQAQRSKCTGE